jgi:hypothetical protein
LSSRAGALSVTARFVPGDRQPRNARRVVLRVRTVEAPLRERGFVEGRCFPRGCLPTFWLDARHRSPSAGYETVVVEPPVLFDPSFPEQRRHESRRPKPCGCRLCLERQLRRGLPGVYEAVISGHRESPPVLRIRRHEPTEVTGDGTKRQSPITRNEGVPGSSPGVGFRFAGKKRLPRPPAHRESLEHIPAKWCCNACRRRVIFAGLFLAQARKRLLRVDKGLRRASVAEVHRLHRRPQPRRPVARALDSSSTQRRRPAAQRVVASEHRPRRRRGERLRASRPPPQRPRTGPAARGRQRAPAACQDPAH